MRFIKKIMLWLEDLFFSDCEICRSGFVTLIACECYGKCQLRALKQQEQQKKKLARKK